MISTRVVCDRVCKFSNSDNIDCVEYNYNLHILVVIFNTGSVYQYYDVPVDVFGSVVTAPSIGKAFNQYVSRREFRYIKLEES